MPALAVVQDRPRLVVMDGGLSPKRGRPSAAAMTEAHLELAMRRSEEQDMDAAMAPLVNRLEMVARQAGPSMWRIVAEIAHLQARHARRWTEDTDGAA